MTGRSLLGGSLAALLLMAPAASSLAQTAPKPADTTAPKPATTAAKPAPAKVSAKKPAPAGPTKKVAAAPKKPEAKKVAAAKKPESKKVASTSRKPAAPVKVAAAAPVKIASAAPPKLAPAAYTVTTTRNHVTYTATHVVPLPPATSLPVTKAAATPVNYTPRAESLTPPAAKAEAATVTAPIATAPTVTATKPADPSAATFVATFLHDAFRLARSSGTTSLQRRAQLADLFSGKMDISRIAGYTTSEELTGTPADFQQRFRTILISYLVETYYPRLELASDPSVTVETMPAAPLPDGTLVVWTTFSKEGWGAQSVKWHLAAEGGGYKIVDIMSAGASLVQMERDTFLSVMRDGGLPELMAKLDARTKSLATAATN
jgi:ABC-type transporter MlaC component